MTMPGQHGGASVQARDRIPSTDLASLLMYLVDVFAPVEQPDRATSWPVLTYDPDQKRLSLNTYGVLRRFLKNKDMLKQFASAENAGFLRDFGGMPHGLTIKMGGRLLDSNRRDVAHHVSALKMLVADELDRLGITPGSILVTDPAAAMASLTRTTRLKCSLDQQQATLVPFEFGAPTRAAAARDKDVARVISAREEIQGEDWLTRMAGSTMEAMASRDDEFDEVQQEILLETLRQDFAKPDSQITRFLNFLEDDALARVRLSVSFAIMEAVAHQDRTTSDGAGHALHDYVQRVITLFDLYGAPEAEHNLPISLSGDFGLDADFSLSDELVRARFYACLPIWAEWKTQIFENRRADPGSGAVSVVRDVSYRFRINGHDHVSKKRAFDSRLDRLRQHILSAPQSGSSSSSRRRDLAQVIFLWLVLNPDLNAAALNEHATQLAIRLRATGRDGVIDLLNDLGGWSERVTKMSTALVSLLRSKTPQVLSQAQRTTRDLYLVVQQSVINWDAIGSRGGKTSEPLVKPDTGRSENVEWFKYIKVARQPDLVPEPLFSVRIVTHLRDRILATSGQDVATTTMRREIPPALLNIVWQPITIGAASPQVMTLATSLDPSWRMGAGVDVLYDPGLLTPHRSDPNASGLNGHQYRAATIVAFTTLVYIVLHVLEERVKEALGNRIPITMLRFQTQGREAAITDGDTIIYAAAQAVEAALMRDTPVRMQGMICKPGDTARQYREAGTAFALFSAFPLVMGMPQPSRDTPISTHAKGGMSTTATMPKIALLAYATRPCDEHPHYQNADGYIFRARTYLADATNGSAPGYRLAFDRMQSHVVESQNDFKSPTLIVEEISRLHSLGYDHILLLSTHFGNRRINRSAQRHSPHTQTTFLDDVAAKFPSVMVYMLRRDVFPATRLHLRERYRESGFEALRLTDHQEFAIDPADNLLKQLIPAYTFATLSIVGKDEAGHPQSGFCTYFLDSDYQVRHVEWREQARANILGVNTDVRTHLVGVLRGLHFLEAEQQPEGQLVRAVLDPFNWVNPESNAEAGEFQAFGNGRRNGSVLLSLPALLSHVSDALHSRDIR